MTLSQFLIFSLVGFVVAIVTFRSCRSFWLGIPAACAVSSLLNVLFEMAKVGFTFRPVDAVFWLPLMALFGFVVALPAVSLMAAVFHVVRGRARSRPPPLTPDQ